MEEKVNAIICPQCANQVSSGNIRCPRCNQLLLTSCEGNCSRCQKRQGCKDVTPDRRSIGKPV
ncbi:MAG: hypothetical protein H6Q65_2869 [Firmicutes bacterium]|nr:hypothetical protein [Bacillota bacterium]